MHAKRAEHADAAHRYQNGAQTAPVSAAPSRAGQLTPTLGAPHESVALQRMQQLHERLRASEADVHRRLGRMLRRPAQ